MHICDRCTVQHSSAWGPFSFRWVRSVSASSAPARSSPGKLNFTSRTSGSRKGGSFHLPMAQRASWNMCPTRYRQCRKPGLSLLSVFSRSNPQPHESSRVNLFRSRFERCASMEIVVSQLKGIETTFSLA